MNTSRNIDATRHGSYQVVTTRDALAPSNGTLLSSARGSGRRLVVIDGGLADSTVVQILEYFELHKITARYTYLEGGEECKTTDGVLSLIQAFEEHGLERREDHVIVFGGGAVLDTAGLAASVYRRGIPFVKVPTTVLSYVDAAIGVKTGVNYAGRKNLIGSFCAPEMVVLSPELLRGCPAVEVRSGFGEVLKAAVACDAELFGELEKRLNEDVWESFDPVAHHDLLEATVDVMLAALVSNLYEGELARSLDLGHTFSQPFEMAGSVETVRHGEAVTADIAICTVIGMARSLTDELAGGQILSLCRRLIEPEILALADPKMLWESVLERTRHRGGEQRIPLPRSIGQCVFVNDLSYEELASACVAVADELARQI